MQSTWKNAITIILPLIFIWSCEKEEDFSVIETAIPTNISTTNATLNGKIVQIGSSPITEHGFVWSGSSDLNVDTSDKLLLGKVSSASTFSQTVEGLEGGQQYYFAAFYEDAGGIKLGEILDFYTAEPIIYNLAPFVAVTGAEISIEGDFFPENESSLSVYFDDKKASIISSSKRKIIVSVPSGLSGNPIKVKVVVGSIEVPSKVDFTLSHFLAKNSFPRVPTAGGNPQFLFGFQNSYYFKVRYPTPEEFNFGAFWSYDATSDEFSRKADFPVSSEIVPLNNEEKSYIVTGINNTHPSNELWEYDVDNNLWKQLNDSIPLPPRHLFDFSFSLNGKSYIGNGYKIVNRRVESFSDLWMYDHLTQEWSQKNDITINSSNVIIFDGKAYIGPDSDNKFWRYNEQSDNWVWLADFPVITDRPNPVDTYDKPYFTFTTTEKLFFGNSVSGEMWSYDLFKDEWVEEPGSIFKNHIRIRTFQTKEDTFVGFGTRILSATGRMTVTETWKYVPSN